MAGSSGGHRNTPCGQTVVLVAMTGVMSRHVVPIGAIGLILAGLIPKVGAVIAAMPIAVLGGGVIMMFGMVAAAGLNMLTEVKMSRRNMMILAFSLSLGLCLNLVPEAMQHLPATLKMLLQTGLMPVAVIAIVLNAVVPDRDD